MSKVAESKNDQEDSARVSSLIVKRLRAAGGNEASEISCADIAGTAWEQGKTILATKLLEYEARASKQVHLLLSMKEDNLALSKATKSGDSDLGKSSQPEARRTRLILVDSALCTACTPAAALTRHFLPISRWETRGDRDTDQLRQEVR